MNHAVLQIKPFNIWYFVVQNNYSETKACPRVLRFVVQECFILYANLILRAMPVCGLRLALALGE